MAATLGIVSIGQDESFFSGRYFREILTATGQTAVERGTQVKIISMSHAQAGSAQQASELLAAHGVDALAVVAPSEALLAAVGQIFARTPGVIISPPRLDITLSYVASDNYGATRQLVEHLAAHGRQRIVLLRPDILTGDYWERTRGYVAATKALSLPEHIGQLRRPVSVEQVAELLATYTPDALLAPSDVDAAELLPVLVRIGRRVPADLALVGFDDEDFAAETVPALTTVSQPIAEMARRATIYLLDRLHGQERRVYHTVLSNRLVVRASCGSHDR